jgi:hypothetical protein
MKNIIATRLPGIILQAQEALPALTREATRIGLAHVKPATMKLHYENLLEARRATLMVHVEMEKAYDTQKTVFTQGRKHVGTARDALRFHLGNQPSASWTHAGYEGSLAVPRTIPPLLVLLMRLANYLKEHPEHENPKMNVTAAITKKLADDLAAAMVAVNFKRGDLNNAIQDRDAKALLVRLDLRMLLVELKLVLDPEDPLFKQFGFKPPGRLQAPEAPEKITVKVTGPTSVKIEMEKPARARRIRVYQKVVGVDQDFVLVAKRKVPDCRLDALPKNAEIQFAFSASNRAGESIKSRIITVKTEEAKDPNPKIQDPEKIQAPGSNPMMS